RLLRGRVVASGAPASPLRVSSAALILASRCSRSAFSSSRRLRTSSRRAMGASLLSAQAIWLLSSQFIWVVFFPVWVPRVWLLLGFHSVRALCRLLPKDSLWVLCHLSRSAT